MAKKCVKFGVGKGGKRVCRSFGGSGTKGLSGAPSGKGKGQCTKWSKGRTKCLVRAK